MTKKEMELMGKLVLAFKCALMMEAGLVPAMKNEVFKQTSDIDKAFEEVKEENERAMNENRVRVASRSDN